MAVAVLAVVLAIGAVGAFLLLRDGDDDFAGAASSSTLLVQEVSVDAGELLVVRVQPDGDLDAVLGFLLADADAVRLAEAYADLEGIEPMALDEAFPAVDAGAFEGLEGTVLLRTDLGFAGDAEEALLATPIDLDVRIVVGPFGPDDAGAVQATVERFPSGRTRGLAGADAPLLLGAAVDDEELPGPVRSLAEEYLDLVVEPEG